MNYKHYKTIANFVVLCYNSLYEVENMNNLKIIRELYGATQEQVAKAINVNRVTVANWENGISVASSSNQEKLSFYYGIGPEFFYEKELDETAREIVVDTGSRAKEVSEKSEGKRNKEEDFHRAFESITFKQALNRYMFSMKMLLATADSGELDTLKTAALINKKMGERLEAIIRLREQEEKSDEPSLFDLIEKMEENK